VIPYKSIWKTMNPTEYVKSTIRTKRKDNVPGNIPVKVTTSGGTIGQVVRTFVMAPGESKDIDYFFNAGPGTYTIRAEAWPSDGSWEDDNPADNDDADTVRVERIEPLPPEEENIRVGL
jgi:hypothetical protein